MYLRWLTFIYSCCLFSCIFTLFLGCYHECKLEQFFRHKKDDRTKLPTIFAITPTFTRLVQKAELTRVSNTFLHVPEFHWIVVEDSTNKTQLVTSFLQKSGLRYTHLSIKTPKGVTKSRGTVQRNLALSWLRDTFKSNRSVEGVVYFADDDNTYSLDIFKEMRYTKKVSVWPVGLTGGLPYQSVHVNASGKVTGWKVKYAPDRPFALDMAGFAINLNLILEKPNACFHLGIKVGFQESSLLQDLATLDDLEPKADNCTKVLVWHTRTEGPRIHFAGFPDTFVEV
ncbi:galactosylgalactosylxylosylprotein 3-beta-glucuronosyltransferase 1-like [Pleurodeles waltl]|uniref:galactosylgalactosylxylosylprotein 3-beta-glucuronosyltransferase 1-like n=1 Tax=Pleurodeles waltl TaxID=8319 RepID=UPI0037099191